MNSKHQLVVISLLLLVTIGCGSGQPSVEGTVTLNGQPIKTGAISFRPVDGTGPSFGSTIVDGSYSVEKAYAGERRVFISAIDDSKMAKSRADADRRIAEAKAKGVDVEEAMNIQLIPPDAEGNNQVVEIEMGAQTLDFAIQTNSP